ncbi:hypothetical protein BDB01DRAFT_88013 [Pilobolus umbonatus]|nr:hypothetical protein BDB01DRAFT_88013 [Pilobolus umbonatus]
MHITMETSEHNLIPPTDIEGEISPAIIEEISEVIKAAIQAPEQPEEQLLEEQSLQQTSDPISPLCQTCQVNNWKYKCPRCHITSCSVECVKKHKIERECSGERDRVVYVPMSKYNESTMMNDYTYLEEVARQSDSLSRSRREMAMTKQGKSIPRLKFLQKQAKLNHIDLIHLPAAMSRHKLNQSNYSNLKRQIFWSIEVHFCRSNKSEQYLEHSVPSSKSFRFFLQNMLISDHPLGKGSYGIIRHQLADFIEAGIDKFVIGLKKENSPQRHYINKTSLIDASINTILQGETVIEYPIFYIWLEGEVPDNVILEESIVLDITEKVDNTSPSDVDNKVNKSVDSSVINSVDNAAINNIDNAAINNIDNAAINSVNSAVINSVDDVGASNVDSINDNNRMTYNDPQN